MILTDAGPLIALVDADDPDHGNCVDALRAVVLPMVTTWAAFTEAMYMVGASGGYPGQQALWEILADGRVRLFHPESDAYLTRVAELMGKYRDVPMDLADATLVAAAEVLDTTRVFTLDTDFHVYRMKRRAFQVLP